jgi:O-acetyl-ADP-ribose deacetylase (regulator of RNase III)
VNGCVNPDHLRWGTRLENAADKVAHGTMARGERVGSAKLTAAQVEEIRERYAAGGIAQEALGREFGVVHATISRIVSGRSWEHAS